MKLYEITSILIVIFICTGVLVGVGQTIYDACNNDEEKVSEESFQKDLKKNKKQTKKERINV
jgi:hypothetical protein